MYNRMDLNVEVKFFVFLEFFESEVLLIGFFFLCRQLSESMNTVVSS